MALLIFHACVLSSMAHISEIYTLKLLEEGAELLRESGGLSQGQGLIGATGCWRHRSEARGSQSERHHLLQQLLPPCA